MKKILIYMSIVFCIVILASCNSKKSKTVLIIKDSHMSYKIAPGAKVGFKFNANGAELDYLTSGNIVVFKTTSKFYDQYGEAGIVYKIDKNLLLNEIESVDTSWTNDKIYDKYLKK